MTNMKMSNLGCQVLMQSEGFVNEVYKDVAGLPTVGVGHLLTKAEMARGKIYLSNNQIIDLRKGFISDEEVLAILRADLPEYESGVSEFVNVALTQHQFDALVHFCFNVGVPAFETSTLRRELNKGNYTAVPENLRRWNKATVGGKKVVIDGLANRREKEVELWHGEYGQQRTDVPAPPVKEPLNPPPVLSNFDLPPALDEWKEWQREQIQSGVEQQYRQRNSKPTHKSKIIGFAAATATSFVIAKFGLQDVVSPGVQDWIESGIVTAGTGAIFVARRWFTNQFLG